MAEVQPTVRGAVRRMYERVQGTPAACLLTTLGSLLPVEVVALADRLDSTEITAAGLPGMVRLSVPGTPPAVTTATNPLEVGASEAQQADFQVADQPLVTTRLRTAPWAKVGSAMPTMAVVVVGATSVVAAEDTALAEAAVPATGSHLPPTPR